ncbi:MAG: ribose 5-phosphate isomerase B [Candidatus Faecousia sp.]|nr:ribose 5-phosphate isomerase B [Oscillospiraceae bacterium]MDD6856109.1 ribose 5-phosphate isomerase B [Oscillospiraceae bacterium]MDY2557756.1 ribose 5-phosphate isomerase B [Candidatus Faecousia sp.]
MKIAIACDHGAFDLKQKVSAHLSAKGYEVVDFGTHSKDSCDYPDFAGPAARAVASGACEKGILLCTTGIGVSITANKVKGIRCALLSDLLSAELTRLHNDTNMMAVGAGVVGENLALAIVDKWLTTPFSGEARHQRRIDKMMALEQE